MRIKLLLLTLSMFWALPVFAQSVDTAWVRRYDGSGNGDDYTYAIAVDGSGNVYVTGYSPGSGTGDDYATIKYDPAGNQLWEKRYNGPGNGDDHTFDIALDDSGNVYVTGYSPGSVTRYDYATIKYDPAGNQLWEKRYNGPGNSDDWASDIAVDGSGNVYITGFSQDSGADYDYATLKYDPAGNQLWEKRYNGPGNSSDNARAIAVNGSGNVYVTGYSIGSGTKYDYATIKYDSAGNQLWEKRYNGSTNADDYAFPMAVDGSGNVYVTGGSPGSGTTYDYATIKYDPAGNQLWEKRYNGPGSGWDWPYAIAVDGSGNVYVTGHSEDIGTSYDYATIKYDPAGNQLWEKRYNGPGNGYDYAHAMAVDGSGNVYVTGYSPGSGTGYDYATIRYDPAGNQLWVKRYNGPGNAEDRTFAIAVNDSGNVYVTGESQGSGTDKDYATLKYAQFLRGDADEDGTVSVSDVIYLIEYLFKGGPAPIQVLQVGDADCDGKVTIGDVIYLVNYLFKGWSPPCT